MPTVATHKLTAASVSSALMLYRHEDCLEKWGSAVLSPMEVQGKKTLWSNFFFVLYLGTKQSCKRLSEGNRMNIPTPFVSGGGVQVHVSFNNKDEDGCDRRTSVWKTSASDTDLFNCKQKKQRMKYVLNPSIRKEYI